MLQKIFLALWAIWCLFVFSCFCLMLLPVLLFAVFSKQPQILRAAHFVPTRMARLMLFLFGIRLELVHQNNIKPDGQYIFISNHRSLLDAAIAGAVIPNYLKFLGKAEMRQWPVLGYLLSHFYVAVNRSDPNDRQKSLKLMKDKLIDGCSFFICPESTCNRGTEFLTHFYSGAFRLSAETGVSLVPLTFVGSGEVWPRSSPFITPGRIKVYFQKPLPATLFAGPGLQNGIQQVRQQLIADLATHYPDGRYGRKPVF